MDLSTSISIIIQDLNRACEIIDDLKKYPGVPLLQIELAKSKCKSAADVISLLPGLDKEVSTPEALHTPGNKDITSRENNQAEIPEPEISEITAVTFIKETISPEPPEKTVIIDKKVQESEAPVNPAAKITVLHSVLPEEEKKSTSNGSGILADQFNNLSRSFNEEIGNMKHEEDIAGRLRSKPLNDLSDAIGVNDRFVFIREIFDGSNETYARAISELNSAANMSDARQVLNGYTGSKTDNEAIRQLMELVKRKFQIHG